ncbi:hypothetical protein Moror_11603 [Moniliophthora roreri MCA 2997]|uniref:Uncharacterized protein n=1 Tax=Moniliophthora roreri (strain MCA 2997) TaxID=1381753 RepID=V2WKS9_MONRO|nr:hypothetical protein Moror_11603 [Moniliophthora roreri MCA 2997]
MIVEQPNGVEAQLNHLESTVNMNHATTLAKHTQLIGAINETNAYIQDGPTRAANAAAFNTGPLHGPLGLP